MVSDLFDATQWEAVPGFDLQDITYHRAKNQGTVRVALFANEQAFKSSAPRIQKEVPAHIDEVWLTFENLPPGRYGISAFHDVNGNEKLDTSFLGLPKEPYGFSQNARGRFGPPNFSDISFDVDSSPKTLDITLR